MSSSVTVSKKKIEENKATFTLQGVSASVANAFRRTMLADIIAYAFLAEDPDECDIPENTSRVNNEVIKHRLSCIPIYADYYTSEHDLENYELVVDVENKTDTILYVTTNDFKLRHKTSGEFMKDTKTLFKPYVPLGSSEEYPNILVKLRPKISEEMPGEKIKLTCNISHSIARTHGTCTVAHTVTYGNTMDVERATLALEEQLKKWRDEELDNEMIDFVTKNWWLKEGKRYFVPDSFDFTIEGIGVYPVRDIIRYAISHSLASRLASVVSNTRVEPAVITIKNCYDLRVLNEDYNAGLLCWDVLYRDFMSASPNYHVTFISYKKLHPHDDTVCLRVAFDSPKSTEDILNILSGVTQECEQTLVDIYSALKST